MKMVNKRSKPPASGAVTLPRVVKKRVDKSLAVNALDVEQKVPNRYEYRFDSGGSTLDADGFDNNSCPSFSSKASLAEDRVTEVKEKELRTIFFAPTENCLKDWRKLLSTGTEGSIDVVYDELIQSQALEIKGKYDGSIGICFPRIAKESMGITMPYLNMIVKNTDRYFSIEIQVLDQVGVKRVFKMSNFQTLVRVTSTTCSMPMRLDVGWNQIIIDISAFVKDAFGTRYKETISLQINANVCIRRIYFASNLFEDAALPNAYKIFPVNTNTRKKVPLYRKRTDKDELTYRMKDIVVDKIDSADSLLDRLFKTTSGYIEITEDSWDKPVLATVPQRGGIDLPKSASQRSIKSVGSTKVFDSASFTKSKKLDPLPPPKGTDSIQLDDFEKIHTGVSYIVPNVAHLLEDMSYVYDFLAVASADAIPQATSDTVDDFMQISQSLRDMASFSDVWESKPMVRNISPNLQKDKPIGTEEVVLSGPGFDVKDGIPVHVTPKGDGPVPSVAPSMEVINLSVSQQIIAQVRKVERLRTQEDNPPNSERPDPNQTSEKPIPPLLQNVEESQVKKKAVNCSDIVQRSNLAIREFASLSSVFLGRLEKSALFKTNFVEAVRRSTREKSSSEEILNHLRRVSQTWKEIANSLDVKEDIARTFALDLDADEAESVESSQPSVQRQLKSIVKGIKQLSQEMIRNFSAESVKALSLNLDAQAKKMEDVLESDEEMEECFKSELGNQMERQVSSFSLKYDPSSSEIFLPIKYKAGKKSRRKSRRKSKKSKTKMTTEFLEEEGEFAEETIVDENAFLNFDGINCEAWTDFFKPDNGKDCNVNIGSMSKIWDKFGRDSEKFPVGFEMTPGKESKASGPGRTPSECSDISGNSFHLSTVKNKRPPRQHDRGDVVEHEHHSNEVKYVPFPNPPSPSVSSYESSRASEDGKSKITCLKKPPISRRKPFTPMINKARGRGRKIEPKKKLTSKVSETEGEQEQGVIVQTQDSSTSLSSASADSDKTEDYPAINVLKQMCLEGIKGHGHHSPHSPGHKHESLFPSDHGFWSPRAMTPNSDSESESGCSVGSGSETSLQKDRNLEAPMTADTAMTGCYSEHCLSTGPPSKPTTASTNLSPFESSDSFDLDHCDFIDRSLRELTHEPAEIAGEGGPEDEEGVEESNNETVGFVDIDDTNNNKLANEETPGDLPKSRKPRKKSAARRKTMIPKPDEPPVVVPEVIFEHISKWKMSTPIISTTGLTKSTTQIIQGNQKNSKPSAKPKE